MRLTSDSGSGLSAMATLRNEAQPLPVTSRTIRRQHIGYLRGQRMERLSSPAGRSPVRLECLVRSRLRSYSEIRKDCGSDVVSSATQNRSRAKAIMNQVKANNPCFNVRMRNALRQYRKSDLASCLRQVIQEIAVERTFPVFRIVPYESNRFLISTIENHPRLAPCRFLSWYSVFCGTSCAKHAYHENCTRC